MTPGHEPHDVEHAQPENQEHKEIQDGIQEFHDRRAVMTDPEKEEKKAKIAKKIKEVIAIQRAQAVDRLSIMADAPDGKKIPDYEPNARSVQSAVTLFVRAAQEHLIDPPTHAPTRIFFEKLIQKLAGVTIDHNDAVFLQPLINGILNVNEYIKFSQPNDPDNTQFERDLQTIVSTQNPSKAELYIEEAIQQAGAGMNITLDQFRAKKAEAVQFKRTAIAALAPRIKQEVEHNLHKGQEREDMTELELTKTILEGTGVTSDEVRGMHFNTADLVNKGKAKGEIEHAYQALELIHSIESGDHFYAYYEKLTDLFLQQLDPANFSSEQKRIDRAAKDATQYVHEVLIYTTNKIFAPVIAASGEGAWNELVSHKSRNQFANLQSVFNNFVGKLDGMSDRESERGHRGKGKIKFYRYGNEKQEKWVDRTDGNGRITKVGGRLVDYTTPSHELLEGTFKELLKDLFISTESEKQLLEAGINFNYLINHAGEGKDQGTFFKKAADYAGHSLPSTRIDELYKLPHADLVEAAKIQISSHYKKKFAKAGWMKNPEILQGLFSNIDEVMREAKTDMLLSFGDVPEWAIKRALVHARMHLSLINLEMHALSSYANAPVSLLDGKATYRDTALKDLDINDTWFSAKQWAMSDLYIKGMAFMPQPDMKWVIENWDHKDITDEGRDIYEESFRLGDFARHGRVMYTSDMAPNIQELNPMKTGGLETQLGWRMKYALFPWLRDMLDNTDNAERLAPRADRPRDLEHAWKRLENIGINPLKVLRDELLFDEGFLKLQDGKVSKEEHYKNLFRFMYDRYFSQGVGKQGLNLTFNNKNHQETTIAFSEISNADEFWNKIVEPIIHRKSQVGNGQDAKIAEKQETKKRIEDLKRITDHALTVLAFERVPMDFAFIENPTRSQNGVTLYSELEEYFQDGWDEIASKSATEKDKIRDEAFNDVLYVQQRARTETAKQMNDFVAKQADMENRAQKTLFGNSMASLDNDRSDMEVYKGQTERRGYVVEEDVIRAYLEEKYKNNTAPERELKVKAALKVFQEIKKRVVLKPMENNHEVAPTLTEVRKRMWYKDHKIDQKALSKSEEARHEQQMKQELKQTFKEFRNTKMKSRFMWSGNELIDNTAAMPINDTAYQFLEFTRGGRDMVKRTLEGVMWTQERYKHAATNGDLLSALKKYYRKEDTETLHKVIVEMRSDMKNENVEWADDMAIRLLENSINVMRMNDDAENVLVELQYIAHHKDRAALSTVVKEGDQYPLRREDRYKIVSDYLHYAQLPKRVKAENEVWEEVDLYKDKWGDQWSEKYGEDTKWIGEAAGNLADKLLGRKEGDIVRQQWKEQSGNGLRDRQIANVAQLLIHEGPKYLALLVLVIMILGMVKGYQAAEES